MVHESKQFAIDTEVAYAGVVVQNDCERLATDENAAGGAARVGWLQGPQ